MRVTEDNTDLRGSRALLGELADLFLDLFGGGLEPRWRVARVRNGGGRNALALAVKTTHDEELAGADRLSNGNRNFGRQTSQISRRGGSKI